MAVAAVLHLSLAGLLAAQEAGVHYWHNGAMPPGAIGSLQLERGGPLPGYFQPVEIKAPPGASISLAVANTFDAATPGPRRAGLLIGAVYRLCVTGIPGNEGLEVFPTIEVVNRLYPPAEQKARFAIPVELTQDELALALAGKFVTRVIYLEDPRGPVSPPGTACPEPSQKWFEVGPGRDPLAIADVLGRPVAILRMGGRVPQPGSDPQFFYGSPPWVAYPPRPVFAPPAAAAGRIPSEGRSVIESPPQDDRGAGQPEHGGTPVSPPPPAGSENKQP